MKHESFIKIITKNERETKKLGKALARQARSFTSSKALVIALEGDLGAGKTVFAKGFAEGLGIKEKMKSPTFILMRAFKIPRANKMFLHFDAYRVTNPREFAQLGFRNFLKDPRNIIFVEWSDNIKSLLPESYIQIRIRHLNKDKREFTFCGQEK